MAAEEGEMSVMESGMKGPAAAGSAEKKEEGPTVRMITVKSADGKVFRFPAAVARLSVILGVMADVESEESKLPKLDHVSAGTMEKVLQYCSKHAEDTTASMEDLKKWDREFFDRLSLDDLYDLLIAANYLSIEGILDGCCKKVADKIKGKTPEEIRAVFNIENDFTKEEEEEMRREYAWAY